MLAESKLNSIDTLISQALIDWCGYKPQRMYYNFRYEKDR